LDAALLAKHDARETQYNPVILREFGITFKIAVKSMQNLFVAGQTRVVLAHAYPRRNANE
jgi:hypothetical protein